MPDDFFFTEARALFDHPEVLDPSAIKLEWADPDVEGIVKFLVHDKQFDEGRVRAALDKLKDAKKKSSQQRLESFFGAPVVTKRKTAASAGKDKKPPAKKRGPKASK